MIAIPGRRGRLIFAASRSGLGWRTPRGEWMRLKPPGEQPLFSERYGYARTIALPFGWRIVWKEREPN